MLTFRVKDTSRQQNHHENKMNMRICNTINTLQRVRSARLQKSLKLQSLRVTLRMTLRVHPQRETFGTQVCIGSGCRQVPGKTLRRARRGRGEAVLLISIWHGERTHNSRDNLDRYPLRGFDSPLQTGVWAGGQLLCSSERNAGPIRVTQRVTLLL